MLNTFLNYIIMGMGLGVGYMLTATILQSLVATIAKNRAREALMSAKRAAEEAQINKSAVKSVPKKCVKCKVNVRKPSEMYCRPCQRKELN